MSDVGKRLREERDRKHLTQVQVFNKTGINNKTLSGYENGVSHPDLESLKVLAKLYGVTTDYLLGDDNNTSIEETEVDRLKREIIEIVGKARNEEDIKSMLHIVKKALKE